MSKRDTATEGGSVKPGLLRRSRLPLSVLVVAALAGCGAPSAPKAPKGVAPRPGVRTQIIVPAQVVVPVADGGSDAEQYADGRVNRSSKQLEMVDGATNQTIGMRFTNVDLMPGTPIVHAYVQFAAASTTSGPATLELRAEASDNAEPLASHNFDLTDRTMTTASVTWTPATWIAGDQGADQRTADLAPVLQEIVDRPGWVAGNAIVLEISGSGTRVAWSYDGQPSMPPTLNVQTMIDNHPPSVDSFTADPNPVGRGEPVTFAWSTSSAEGQALSCTLDVNGDGAPEFSYPDCNAGSGETYTYAASGSYDAVLSVKDTDNTVVQATIPMTVQGTVVIGVAGDIACDPSSSKFNGGLGTSKYCRELYTSNLLLDMQPDAVLTLGDTQYEKGTLDAFYQAYDPTWGRLKNITFPSVGNHEYITSGATGYYQYFGAAAGDPSKGYYSFNLGNWHFVALNSNCSKAGGCRAGSPQELWLRQDLAANPRACTLAFWHHPLFSSGAIGGRWWTQDLWQALMDYDADIVLNGHDHNYERFGPQDVNGNADPNGLVEFVVGTGGKNPTHIDTPLPNSIVTDSGTMGVLKMVLKPDSYSFAFVPDNGTFTDTGSASCH